MRIYDISEEDFSEYEVDTYEDPPMVRYQQYNKKLYEMYRRVPSNMSAKEIIERLKFIRDIGPDIRDNFDTEDAMKTLMNVEKVMMSFRHADFLEESETLKSHGEYGAHSPLLFIFAAMSHLFHYEDYKIYARSFSFEDKNIHRREACQINIIQRINEFQKLLDNGMRDPLYNGYSVDYAIFTPFAVSFDVLFYVDSPLYGEPSAEYQKLKSELDEPTHSSEIEPECICELSMDNPQARMRLALIRYGDGDVHLERGDWFLDKFEKGHSECVYKLKRTNIDYIFNFLKFFLSFVLDDNDRFKTLLTKIHKFFNSIPISTFLKNYSLHNLKIHLHDLTKYLYTLTTTEQREQRENGFFSPHHAKEIVPKFIITLNDIEILRKRVADSDEQVMQPLVRFPCNIPLTRQALEADDLSPDTIDLWRKKFQNYPTLEEALLVYGEDKSQCIICLKELCEVTDVAILSECGHVCCLPCAQALFIPSATEFK